MDEKTRNQRAWWSDYALGIGQMGRWRIGPLFLNLYRLPHEWQIAFASLGDRKDETAEIEVPAAYEPPSSAMEIVRYTFRDTPDTVSLAPMLADRPVVVKPETPLFVPAGEHVTLFVGCPVTLLLKLGRTAHEIPTHRPSDTWFGPNSRVGELCYASTTLARLRLEDCTIRPHRAITAVAVHNDGADALLVEQLRLPAPHLALYCTEDGALWTQSVTLTRGEDDTQASLRIGDVSSAGGVLRRVAEPRQVVERNIMVQAFSRLFS